MHDTEARRLRMLHAARAREIDITFQGIPEQAFVRGLELGAGDCFQSRLLKRYVVDLLVTDFDWEYMDRSDQDLHYERCDAEQVDRQFAGQRFDLVFSSNMLPHTPDQQAVLLGIGRVLVDQGVVVLVMPSPWWKIFKLALFYPLLLLHLPRRLVRKLVRLYQFYLAAGADGRNVGERYQINNHKGDTKHSKLRALLAPLPVGLYPNNLAEVLGSRRKVWVDKLTTAGWEIVAVRKGPFIVGQLNEQWNALFARLGFSTEDIYIAKKAGSVCYHESIFRNSGATAEGERLPLGVLTGTGG